MVRPKFQAIGFLLAVLAHRENVVANRYVRKVPAIHLSSFNLGVNHGPLAVDSAHLRVGAASLEQALLDLALLELVFLNLILLELI